MLTSVIIPALEIFRLGVYIYKDACLLFGWENGQIGENTGSMEYFIDVEASGLGEGSYPIEVGLAQPDGQCLCSLIHPHPNWTSWEPAAEQAHGITRETLLAHGRPAVAVADWLNELLAGQHVYTDCWQQERKRLAMLFYQTRTPQRFVLEPIQTLLSEQQVDHWVDIKRAVTDETTPSRRRASIDAHVTQMTYQRCMNDGKMPNSPVRI